MEKSIKNRVVDEFVSVFKIFTGLFNQKKKKKQVYLMYKTRP